MVDTVAKLPRCEGLITYLGGVKLPRTFCHTLKATLSEQDEEAS